MKTPIMDDEDALRGDYRWKKTCEELPNDGETVIIKRDFISLEIAYYKGGGVWIVNNYAPLGFAPKWWLRIPKLDESL